MEELTTWTGWRRGDYTGTSLRDIIYDTEEQPEWRKTPSVYGVTMLLAACERLGRILAIVASKHFRKAFKPLEILQHREFGCVADGVIHYLIHEGLAQFAMDIRSQRVTTGPGATAGSPIDTPRRGARALRCHMREVANRVRRGLREQDSTATPPHLHFFRFIAPGIIGYNAPQRGHSWNSWGVGTRTGEPLKDKRPSTQPTGDTSSTQPQSKHRPCMWHVTSLTDFTTRRGERFSCRTTDCKLSHETTTLDNIIPPPTKEDIRKWDAGTALKTKVAAQAGQIQVGWI